jgi:hypothetical protein
MRSAIYLALALPLIGCAGLSTPDTTVFSSGLLNAAYYGAYTRPVNDAAPLADAEARAVRHDERVAAADERDEARAALRQQRDEERQQRAEERQADAEQDNGARESAEPESEPVDEERQPEEQQLASASDDSLPIATTSVEDDVYSPDLAAAYVRAVYALNEVAIAANAGIVDIWRQGQENGTIYHDAEPAGGDLVFFHNTYDRNGDGRNNDWFTHVGIVEGVDSDGTISVLSYRSGRVGRIYVNLHDPSVATRAGAELNSELREPSSADAEFTQHLSGELFAGFVSLLGDVAEVRILDAWQPDATTPVASR